MPIIGGRLRLALLAGIAMAVAALGLASRASAQQKKPRIATAEQATQYFARLKEVLRAKQIVTFVGYSDEGYEDEGAMLEQAHGVLATLDPKTTLVNIGVLQQGIGKVYPVAAAMGFKTTGVVSKRALEHPEDISPRVDYPLYIEDETWGGFDKATGKVSPTSRVMYQISDRVVGIGGGRIAGVVLRAAYKAGIPVEFYPADMSHAKAAPSTDPSGEAQKAVQGLRLANAAREKTPRARAEAPAEPPAAGTAKTDADNLNRVFDGATNRPGSSASGTPSPAPGVQSPASPKPHFAAPPVPIAPNSGAAGNQAVSPSAAQTGPDSSPLASPADEAVARPRGAPPATIASKSDLPRFTLDSLEAAYGAAVNQPLPQALRQDAQLNFSRLMRARLEMLPRGSPERAAALERYQRMNLASCSEGLSPQGTVFLGADLGARFSPNQKVSCDVVDGHRGLTMIDLQDPNHRMFGSFDRQLTQETRTQPDGRGIVLIKRTDARGKVEPTQVQLTDPKAHTVMTGTVASGQIVLNSLLVNGKKYRASFDKDGALASVVLDDYRKPLAALAALSRIGFLSPGAASLAEFLLANITNPPAGGPLTAPCAAAAPAPDLARPDLQLLPGKTKLGDASPSAKGGPPQAARIPPLTAPPSLEKLADGSLVLIYQIGSERHSAMLMPSSPQGGPSNDAGFVADTKLDASSRNAPSQTTLCHYVGGGTCWDRYVNNQVQVANYELGTGPNRSNQWGHRAAVERIHQTWDPNNGCYFQESRETPAGDTWWDEFKIRFNGDGRYHDALDDVNPLGAVGDFLGAVGNVGKDLLWTGVSYATLKGLTSIDAPGCAKSPELCAGYVAENGEVVNQQQDSGSGWTRFRRTNHVNGVIAKDVTLAQRTYFQSENPGADLMHKIRGDIGDEAYKTFRASREEMYRQELLKTTTDPQTAAALERPGAIHISDDELGGVIISGRTGDGIGGTTSMAVHRMGKTDNIAVQFGFGTLALANEVNQQLAQMVAFEGVGELGSLARVGAQATKADGIIHSVDVGLKGWQDLQTYYFRGMLPYQMGFGMCDGLNEWAKTGNPDGAVKAVISLVSLGFIPGEKGLSDSPIIRTMRGTPREAPVAAQEAPAASPTGVADLDGVTTKLASMLHDEWRAPRRIAGTETYEPRIKDINGTRYDIANLNYEQLPEKFQFENRESARVTTDLIDQQVRAGHPLDDAFLERASSVLHDEWLERNRDWASEEQKLPFERLSEAEAEKDRVIIRKGIEVFRKQQLAESMRRLSDPAGIAALADEAFPGRPQRLALAGYSAAPVESYEAQSATFLRALVARLGPEKTGFVTSPTADAGSIDAVGTSVGQELGLPTLYVTAENYTKYIDPGRFPPSIDQSAYARASKFILPDGERYSEATAVASNGLLVTGGRDVSVGDFVNAIKRKNRVVIVDNPDLGDTSWDSKKGRPNNAARYLIGQLDAASRGAELPYPEIKGLTKDFLATNRAELERLVKVVHLSDPAAVDEAAAHLSEDATGSLAARSWALASSVLARFGPSRGAEKGGRAAEIPAFKDYMPRRAAAKLAQLWPTLSGEERLVLEYEARMGRIDEVLGPCK